MKTPFQSLKEVMIIDLKYLEHNKEDRSKVINE